MKKVLVTGSSGFVADYVMRELSRRVPHLKIIGMSRSGVSRHPELMGDFPNVTYFKGNCLHPEEYKDILQDVDGLIHSVGSIVEDTSNPELTFKAMNRDSAVNMARDFNAISTEEEMRKFVLISTAEAPLMQEEYLRAFREAEDYVTSKCPKLDVTILRPGYIWSKDFKQYGYDEQQSLTPFFRKIMEVMVGSDLPYLFGSETPNNLETVGHFACEGVLGNLDEKLICEHHMLKYDDDNKV